MEILRECPVCNGQSFENFLKCKDYTVSQDLFQIVNCTTCGFKFTNPRPDANEIGRYYESAEYISHSNSKKGLINKIYQVVRKRAIDGKIALINKEAGQLEKSILDIGCGTGEFLSVCKEKGWKTKGIEPNDNARTQGIKNYSLDIEGEEALKGLGNQYSIISMWHVLEHVHQLNDRVKQIYSLLQSGGKAIIAVPNYTSDDANRYKEYWAAYDVPRHLYHFSPESMEKLLKTYDLRLITCKPMWFDSFYVSMLSEKYKNGKGNILKAVINGFLSNLKAWGNTKKCSSVIYVICKSN